VEGLVNGGTHLLEITTNTPGFALEIEKARARYSGVLIGAGTVTNVALAEQSLGAGAQFLVSPNVNKELGAYAVAKNVPLLMGAMTPTEVNDALLFGADIIKLFPAVPLGIPYFKALKGPFGTCPFYAVGGVDGNNMLDWFKAGATGVGLGGSLIGSGPYSPKDVEQLADRAKTLLQQLY
jgi:2-dehydro-3-deoxyphosphogluconate aldolase/(4S)-4-hydroxy-2-oxoglutarate aldolase